MANRINTFLLKRSSIPGKIPSPGQLLLGEIALNSADAMLYTSGTTANSILPIGWDRISRTGDTMSGDLYAPTISATTYLNLPISIVNLSNLFSTGLIDTGTNVDSITYSNFFGEGAGSSALYASDSNFFGHQSGFEATNANDSNFIGKQAGYGATYSNDSNFIGTHAGSGATNAHNSNFIGNEAGNNAISASDSNFMGHYAGNGATSAYNSNFFGLSAGHEAINAHQSNFIGNEAGTNADNADFSNFMGQLAGAFAVNARHSNFIGQNAGYQATEGEYSNFLGYNVGNGGVLGSLGSNNIIIGTNISLPSGTTSSLNLGGVLFGKNTYEITTGDPSIVAQTNGKIGINVVNPSEALDVYGNALINGDLIANTISATTYYNLPLDVKVTGSTLNPGNYDFTLTRNDGVTITSNLGILSSDMTVTGGTYNINTGVVTFTNNSGGTFNVTGFTSGMTDTFTTGGTYSDGTTIFTKTNGETYSVSGYTTPFTGGTVSGSTTFTNGLTTNTFSATTYLGLPTDIRVTGGTYGSGTTVFSNNTGGTFNITGYTYIPHLQYNNSNSTVWNYGYGNLSDNISFGKNALVSTTNGNNNTAFGSESLSANTTGNYNAGIGTGSLKYNTTGVQNFGIGAYALHYNTTGNYNTGIGTAALQNNTGAERNVAIGGFSLYNNTGSRNIAIGFYAGSATKGSDNILFGANSNNVTDGIVSGSNNTIIGTSLSGVINGSNNTIFGKPTGLSSTTTNNIVIADGSGNIRFRDNNINTILPRLAGSGNRMVIAGPNGELSSTTIFDTFVTGGTYSDGTAVFNNNAGGTFSVTGFSTSNGVTFTGGTVSGATIFTNGLTANTISATTYYNLPTDINVTGGTYSAGTAVFSNNTGGTFSVTGFSTSNGVTFTGGTVNGATIFTNGLTANTFSATSINKVDYMVFNTGTTSAATVAGTVYFDNTEHALSYNTSINQGVTVNLGQQNYIRVFNNSGTDIQRGKALEVLSAYSGLPSVTLAINKHTGFNIIGVSAEIIPNNSEGIAITYGIISNIEMTGMTIGSFVYASDTILGKLDDPSKYLNFPLTARTNQIGYVVQTGTTTGKLFVDIKNENSVLSLTDLERNVLEGNTLSTGLFEFTGMTTASTTTFNVASLKGWLIKNTYTYALLPDVQSINYTGGTNIPVINILTSDSTYILINSGITITQQVTFPTPQQRRENIYLGKINHPNRSTILNINNTADYDVSPMSSLRDLWSPIKLINQGIIPSPNGANLSFNTSAGILWGNGINWHNNQLSPNNVNIAAKVPASFNYRTRTGGTSSSVTVIDPRNYDVGGVITSIGNAGIDDATNQRIYMYPTGVINVLYGQTKYANLTAAVAAIQSETFIPYPNTESTGILIGVLSVRNDIGTDGQPLTNPDYAKFTLVSKFGESFGGTGGLSTTTLQQAYDNSSNPEIVINATLDGLTIQNGTGNADNVTRLLEGSNAAANVTSFIRADGYISGTTFQTNGTFLNNGGITATTVSATTYLNLPTSGGGTFTGGTVTGPTTFTNGLTANTISATTYYNLPLDVYVTGSTLNPANYDFTLTRNDGVTITSNLGILSSDMTVTGGTYDINTGVVTFTNNSGGTFNVTGFTSGMTDTFTTGGTVSSGTATFTKSDGSIYSVSGFSIGNEYWSSGSGLNSVIQTGSNSLAGGTGALAGGSGNSANSQYSVALGINSIADGFEILPVKTQKTVMSGITMTSSDPYNGYPAVVFSGVDVYSEWYNYFYGPYGSESSFVIDDGVGNTYTLYDYTLTDIYNDGIDTYIVDTNILLTSYITISGSSFYDLPTQFQKPAFVFGSNSLVTGDNSIVLGSNITGTSDNTTYVDYFEINRFKNNSVIFGTFAGKNATNASNSNFLGTAAGYDATNASNSNFIGDSAGFSATSANQSNFIGKNAGRNATGAYESNFMGYFAGSYTPNAFQSNFIGSFAGYNATSASNSNFFGNSAGAYATASYNSNFLGELAGMYAPNAEHSNFLGNQAGYGATNATRSNFMGINAGNNAINAQGSNFIGPVAGLYASGASYSNLFGYAAGRGDILGSIGSNNIIIGTNISLPSGTTNSINLGGVLFGQNTYSALTDSPSISGQTNGRIGINVVNPSEALHVAGNTLINGSLTANTISATTYLNLPNMSPINIISGSSLFSTGLSLTGLNASGVTNSNFFGPSAGYQAANASGSTFIGFQAGYNATNASRSNFLGYQAGWVATNATLSTFIGLSAGYNSTNASGSTFIGNSAGLNAPNASYSNFFGSLAGIVATNANHSNFFGRNAGYQATIASYSNLFGYNVGRGDVLDSIGSNNIIIGTNISLPSLTTNSINIGGVLFGINTYEITTGIPSISAQTNGRIGINVVNPSEALHVAGNTLINGNLIANTISATTYYNLPVDVRVTGGTYSAGTAVFSNNTGGTFSITGFSTSTGSGTFTGGTVTGSTTFTNGLSANIFSATTYQNLPLDIRVTGGTYNAGTAIFSNNTGGTFSVTGFSTSTGGGETFTGGTVTGSTTFTNGLTANTISATTYLNLPAGGSSFSGGTVTGPTTFTNGLTANTISATTIEGGDLDFMMVSLFRTLYNY